MNRLHRSVVAVPRVSLATAVPAALAAALVATACQSVPENDPAVLRAAAAAVGDGSGQEAGPDPAAGTSPAPTAAAPAAADPDFGTLRDPEFRRRFRDSWLAETEIEPTVTAGERDAMLKVMDLIAAEKLDEAMAAIEANRGGAASAAFDFALGNIHYQQERLDEAAAAYQVAVDKHPKFRRAWSRLAEVRYRQGQFAGAVTAFTRVLEQGGGDAVTYGLLGICHSKGEDYVSAESAFKMATMVDPAAMEWRVGLGESLFRQNRFADAAALFGALIAEHPERPDLWRFQGEAYALSNQPLKAAECFEMACSLGGATTEMLNNLGLIYARQEIHDMAVNSYLAAIDKDPATSLEPALNVAKFLSANGAHGELRRLIEGIESRRGGALDLDDRKDLLRLRARIAVAEGAGDEEAAVLAKIVELDPLDGDALILLGRHRGRHGEFEQAALFFERAAGLEAHEAEAKLRHGELLAKQGKYAQALPYLRRAHALMDQRDDVQKFLEQVERIAQAR